MTNGTADPQQLAAALAAAGYLADEQTATTAWLAGALGRPLLVEGDPGVGKTSLARALARLAGSELIRLQCHEGLDVGQALYDWDFPRQVLHLRAVQAAAGDGAGEPADRVAALEQDLWSERFLLARPVLRALRTPGSVLLVDELDRADDEFEALLLEVLSEFSVTVPELGTVTAADPPPFVVITSNRTRELHDALKRRCLHLWLDHPDAERERAILQHHVPEAPDPLTDGVLTAVRALRELPLVKPPGIAESIDWVAACRALGATGWDPAVAAATLGAVLKYREDRELAAAAGIPR